jgi:acetyl-CoA acyltransferase 1
MVQNRLNAVNEHFGANSNYNGGQVGPQRPDDVVIIGMARTAMTKAKRGAQKDTPLEAMLKPVFEATIKQSGVAAKEVEEVIIGNVLAPGSAATQIRMAMFLAGIPETASC